MCIGVYVIFAWNINYVKIFNLLCDFIIDKTYDHLYRTFFNLYNANCIPIHTK